VEDDDVSEEVDSLEDDDESELVDEGVSVTITVEVAETTTG
jgi:hypothetical protein